MKHIPVMVNEVLKLLNIRENMIVIDSTFGLGGHSARIAKIIGRNGKIFGFEKDEKTYEEVQQKFKNCENVKIFNESYEKIDEYLKDYENKIDAVLFDLGVSSMQIDEPERGFSFQNDGPLDMRFSKKQSKTAKHIVNKYPIDELKNILKNYGEERFAGRIANAISKARDEKEITTTKELENIVYHSVNKIYEKTKHPATRTFQALRIETNDEFKVIERAIEKAVGMLKIGGRIGVISFHSLEDRIVKNKLKEFTGACICPPKLPVCLCNRKPILELITRKPIYPTQLEISENPRSRSAIFRVAEKL